MVIMRLTRLYIPDCEFVAGKRIVLNPDHAHYLLRVLRMEAGQPLVVFNHEYGGWQAELEIEGKKAIALLQQQIQTPVVLSDIWMLLAPLKKEAWNFCVEKITELGASALQPVVTDYTQNARVKDDRNQANMIEAAQQSERTNIPQYFTAEKLDRVLQKWDANRVLYVALERGDAMPALGAFDVTKPAAILIGPEGGFSEREKELFLRYDFIKPVSLGSLILRAETAAVTSLAIWGGKRNSQVETALS